MHEAAVALSNNPDFSSLSASQAEKLLVHAQRRTFSTGATLMREGSEGSSMIFLSAGEIEVRRGDKVLATLEAGQTLGEMSLLDPAPRSATAVAVSDGTCFELQRDALWGMLAAGDEVAIAVLQGLTATVCSRLAGVNGLVQEEVLAPSEGNVFQKLWAKVGRLGRK